MKKLAAALICVAALPTPVGEPRRTLPTVMADSVTIREVRRASEITGAINLADSPDMLLLERPAHAQEGATMGVFVVGDDGLLLRRVVTFGRASRALIQIVNGVSPGDRVVVSEMDAWDQFDRLRLRR
jgi:hypothetical protein